MITTLLDHNLSVNILQVGFSAFQLLCYLQRKLDDATATKLQKIRKLENITEAHFEKRLEEGSKFFIEGLHFPGLK